MRKSTERKYGEIPEWAKAGEIGLRNYDLRVEAHNAERSAKRGGSHPIITRKSTEFRLWHEYFARHLGGFPWAFQALLDEKIESMTLPEQEPQWFDPSFAATPGYRVPPPPPEPTEEQRLRMKAKFAALLATLPKRPGMVERKAFRRYSDDEIRAMYNPLATEAAE